MQNVPSGGSVYQIRHLQRLPLGTSYVAVVAHVQRVLQRVPRAELVIDLTGVGVPVRNIFLSEGLSPTGIVITGGGEVKQHGSGIIHCPKLTLISRLQVLLHQGRLKIHKEIPDAPVLVRELQDYRTEFTPSGQLTYNARSSAHDDLLLATALAAFVAYGGHFPSAGIFEMYRKDAAALSGVTQDKEVVAVDLGQSRDPTAICVLRKTELPAAAAPPDPEPLPHAGL
jgi:hypothetical protein